MHPDALNDKAAAGDSRRGGSAGPPASAAEVVRALENVLRAGGLSRIPKKARAREILLAAVCVRMQRRRAYTEGQINETLESLLTIMKARVDHVTCRRALVDHGFIRRDRSGANYLLNTPRLELALSSDGMEAAGRFLESLADH